MMVAMDEYDVADILNENNHLGRSDWACGTKGGWPAYISGDGIVLYEEEAEQVAHEYERKNSRGELRVDFGSDSL